MEKGLPSGPEVEGFRASWVDVEGNLETELTIGVDCGKLGRTSVKHTDEGNKGAE